MNVLVTGGQGFIGSEIVEHYAELGASVLVVDNRSSNVVSADWLPGVRAVRCDAARYFSAMIPPRERFDVVVHCASPVGPAGILQYRGRIASMILGETAAIIRYCVAHETPLVNVSTSEVYGTSGVYRESDDLRVPAVPSARIEYAIGKMAAEAECRLTPGLRSVSIRPFNVAGPRQSRLGGFVLPTFAAQAVAGSPLTVFEDGSQRRALTSVTDLARFVTGLGGADFDGRVVNVGNPANQTTMLQLAIRVKAAAGSASRIVHTTGKAVHGVDYEEAEGHVKVPDITLAKSMGWQPRVSLDDLVSSSIVYARRLEAA